MVNDDDLKARMRPAWEARASKDPESIRGRSKGIYDVLGKLENGATWRSDRLGEALDMKRNNINRILLSLTRQKCVERAEKPDYDLSETEDGRTLPVRLPYHYQITERGRQRLLWLRENKPWEQ
jgi:transcription initiation factor IIE alpha subunit